MSHRFRYLEYDSYCGAKQKELRLKFLELEENVEFNIGRDPDQKVLSTAAWDRAFAYCDEKFQGTRGYHRGKAALQAAYDLFLNSNNGPGCLDYMELAYMWFGKAIRDEQLKRNGINV